jgi:hypothetical protein
MTFYEFIDMVIYSLSMSSVCTKKPENPLTLRLLVLLIRARRSDQLPQPPPQECPPVLQTAPLPLDENVDTSFLAFFSLQ